MAKSLASLWLLLFIPQSFCLNALLISLGLAGHVTPMFELAKAMKNHNVTFLTQQLAQSYIDVKSYSSSTFHIVYTNDSSSAFLAEKNIEQQATVYFTKYPMFDAMSYVTPLLGQSAIALLNKTIHILMLERFDVIIADSMIVGVNVLSEKSSTPCVIQNAPSFPFLFDFNLPNVFSLLSSKDLTHIKSRVYNVAFILRMAVIIVQKLLLPAHKLFQFLPRIPGPFYDSFTLNSLLSSKSKCLELVSMPSSFYTPSYSHHYKKYLGAFVDETFIRDVETDLTRWIKSKPATSVIYTAFGSSSLISHERMVNLINGLAAFLLQLHDNGFLMLAFRNANYDVYRTVLKEQINDEYRHVLNNESRVRVENGFVEQKWILKQSSVKLFLSHCGMGSALEALYFEKPILCMPFNMEQFANAIAIDHLGVGLSLFAPPSSSSFRSLISPYDYLNYTFTANNVANKLLTLWMNEKYGQEARIMSLEMKHAGGLKRAVEEIEFFVNLNGSLDRYAPFQTTLPFYQRWMLDLLMIFIILPLAIVGYLLVKCCRRKRKEKAD